MFTFDGVLGLALDEMSQGKDFNLIQRLSADALLREPIFSVFLSDGSDSDESEITFGEIAYDHLGSELIWADVLSNTGYWEIQISDITVNNVPRSICIDCKVAVDTGTSELAGPSNLVQEIQRVLDIHPDCSNYDSLPNLGFIVNGYILNLEPRDYVDREGSDCDMAMMALDVPPPNGPLIVFGIPFLQRFYTVYDATAKRVGFGVAKRRTEQLNSGVRLTRIQKSK
jgi:hypothetical protein